MGWTIAISKTAQKQLEKLDFAIQKKIVTFLRNKLEGIENPKSQGKALQGDRSGLWRYRVGDYRIICHLNDDSITVLVLALGHRKEIYRSSSHLTRSLH